MKCSVLTGALGSIGDRFVMEGYKPHKAFARRVKALSGIEGLQGIEVSNYGEESDGEMVKAVLSDHGLVCVAVDMFIANRRIYRNGSLGNPDPRIRRTALDECKRAMDYAESMGAEVITLWPGQDGHDYALSCDYRRQYDLFLENLVRAADHNRGVNLALEYKSREPRSHSLIENAATALLMAVESGRTNIGVCVDTEHVFAVGGSIGADISLCASRGKLFHVHVNDCVGAWFDGMAVGATHFAEYIELTYMLRKYDYQGWCSLDLAPCREDSAAVVRESIGYLEQYEAVVDRIGMEALDHVIVAGDAMRALRLLWINAFGMSSDGRTKDSGRSMK